MSQVNQGLWFFLIIASGFSIIWLFDAAYRKFRFQFDPIKKVRQEIADQIGLKMTPMHRDIFALQGSYCNRFARLFTTKRGRIGYEIWINNPNQLEFSIRSLFVNLAFKNPLSANPSASHTNFFGQFKIGGKSANIASQLLQNEALQNMILKFWGLTGGLKIVVVKDRIICHETGFRIVSTVLDEVSIARLAFDILTKIARLIENDVQ